MCVWVFIYMYFRLQWEELVISRELSSLLETEDNLQIIGLCICRLWAILTGIYYKINLLQLLFSPGSSLCCYFLISIYLICSSSIPYILCAGATIALCLPQNGLVFTFHLTLHWSRPWKHLKSYLKAWLVIFRTKPRLSIALHTPLVIHALE